MKERVRPTKTGLFMTELLICVGVFSLCAAVCVGLFVKAEVMSRDSADLNQAVVAAKNAAECYKAAGGDMERTMLLTHGWLRGDGHVMIWYDSDWQQLESYGGLLDKELDDSNAAESNLFRVELAPTSEREATLRVTDWELNEILSWNIAALEVRP